MRIAFYCSILGLWLSTRYDSVILWPAIELSAFSICSHEFTDKNVLTIEWIHDNQFIIKYCQFIHYVNISLRLWMKLVDQNRLFLLFYCHKLFLYISMQVWCHILYCVSLRLSHRYSFKADIVLRDFIVWLLQ